MSWHINALEIHLMKMRCACVVPLGGWSLTCTSGAGKRQSSVDAWWKSWMPTRPLVGKLMKSYRIRCLILWRAGNDTSAKSWRSLEFELWHEDQESSLSQEVAKWRLIDSNHNDEMFLEWGWLFIFAAHSARNNKRWHKKDGYTVWEQKLIWLPTLLKHQLLNLCRCPFRSGMSQSVEVLRLLRCRGCCVLLHAEFEREPVVDFLKEIRRYYAEEIIYSAGLYMIYICRLYF